MRGGGADGGGGFTERHFRAFSVVSPCNYARRLAKPPLTRSQLPAKTAPSRHIMLVGESLFAEQCLRLPYADGAVCLCCTPLARHACPAPRDHDRGRHTWLSRQRPSERHRCIVGVQYTHSGGRARCDQRKNLQPNRARRAHRVRSIRIARVRRFWGQSPDDGNGVAGTGRQHGAEREVGARAARRHAQRAHARGRHAWLSRQRPDGTVAVVPDNARMPVGGSGSCHVVTGSPVEHDLPIALIPNA